MQRRKLIGELVGLARATDGNEHLITPESTAVLRRCLTACGGELEDAKELLSLVDRAKREMVPDCFLCASPCGKNSAYDVSELASAPSQIRALKEGLLSGAIRLAGQEGGWEEDLLLYQALILVGMEAADEHILGCYLEKINRP